MQRPRGDNQQRILDFIKSEIQTKGYPPSVREIAQAVGLKSTSTVHGHLQRLEKRGLLHRDAMKPRAMEVTGDPNFIRNNSTAVPVVGRVTAGQPIFAEENLEEYALPADGMIIRQMERKGKVSRRTWFALVLMLLVVPLLLYLSVRYFHGRKYLICSLIVIIAAMIPFFMMFEGRKPKAREIMVISVLAAIGVAGRAAFFMVPSFKPVAAIVILTGISFGGEAGFLVGCLIMMLSNMFMGQGPWTPWQMFAFGMIGFLAGILYQKGILKARKADLCIFGFLSVFLIYGGIMNPASALMAYGTITWQSLLAFYISGAPVDLVHALSTVIFLWFLRPLLEKLERIKKKYGLIESQKEEII